MSETPRTDAALFDDEDAVPARVSRQLERELNAAKAEQRAMLQQTKELHALVKALERKFMDHADTPASIATGQ